MAVLLATAAALSFGASDFAGGLAARRAPVVGVTVVSTAAGFLILLPALGMFPGTSSVAAWQAGLVAGAAGITGLVLYLRGLAIGPMGVASPLAGVTGAALPVVVGLLAGERPTYAATAGIVLGLVAVVLATGRDLTRAGAASVRGPLLALLGGVGFGIFFVGLDAAPADSGLWPLLAARIISLVLVVGLLAVRWRPLPADPGTWWLAVATGVLDMVANGLFLAATRAGLLSIAALLSSLYPVVVAALAAGLLRERLDPWQWSGVAAGVAAVALIATA